MLSRGFVVLWFAMLVATAGISMVSPLLPVHVQNDLGGPALAVALSFSGLSLAQIAASPFAGRFGDRFGPKRFIVIGFAIYAVGGIGYLFAPTWEIVVGFRILTGIGAAGIFPMSLAYVGRLAPAEAEGRFMGWFSVAQAAGFGIGPLFGGGLRDAFGTDAAFVAMAILLGGAALATFLLLPAHPRSAPQEAAFAAGRSHEEEAAPAPSFWRLMRLPGVQAAALLVFLSSLGWGIAATWVAVFVIDREGLGTDSALFVGVLLSSRSLITAVLQPFTGVLADRTNRVLLVVVGLSISGAAQFCIPLVPRQLVDTTLFGAALTMAPWVLVAFLIAGIAESLALPAQQAIFVQIGRRVGMGSLMGVNSMGSSVGFLGGSLAGAFAKDAFGIDSVFYVAGVVTLGGALIFVRLMRRAGDELRDETPDTRGLANVAATGR